MVAGKENKTSKPIAGPLFKETNLQRIIESQNYKGYKSDQVKRLVHELAIQESLEELLAALK